MAEYLCILAVSELERIENIPRRILRDREDAYSLREELFIRFFRLNKETALFITERIKDLLPPEGLPPHLRVLIALRFYAAGGYQQIVANDLFLAVSQMTVSRCLSTVSLALCQRLLNEEVSFPTTTEEQHIIKLGFYSACGIPGVIGALDCTHVLIKKPAEQGPTVRSYSYMNRKHNYSINVQLICDHNEVIRAVNAKFPGSAHDSFIWHQSKVRDFLLQQYEAGSNCGWLLGDSGYPLEPWLLTPYPDPKPKTLEEVFNEMHVQGRNAVERCNGLLKARFQCLLKHRALHYEPTQASRIINACAILHNICLKRRIEFSPDEDEVIDEDEETDGEESYDEDEDFCLNSILLNQGPLRVEGTKIRNGICSQLRLPD